MMENPTFEEPMQIVNPILDADAYTIAGQCLVSDEAKERSVYYMANRYSPQKAWPDVAKDDRMVFWGLSHYIQSVLTTQVTEKHLLEAIDFMEQARFGNQPLKFDYKMWKRVIDEYDGYLPIVIEGLPEGSTFYPHQPMAQVTSLGKGFGEIAAHIEAVMVGQVSCATARATLTAHWYEEMARQLAELSICTAPPHEIAHNMIHDFGMRASSTKEEALVYGLAHLLFFNGTDTFNAAFHAYRSGVKNAGKSVLALAHRIVQSYDNEGKAYTNLSEQDNLGSYVADCYDFKRAVVEQLIPLAKSNPDKTVVVRPDSGDAIENALFVCKQACEEGLYIENCGLKSGTNLRIIEGNSVTPQACYNIMKALRENGYNPVDWIVFGVGGYLRNNVNRDSLSSAYKLNSVGVESRPVMKFSEVETKESIPGPIELVNGVCVHRSRIYNPCEIADRLKNDCKQRFVTYYNGGKIANWVGDYKDVYDRVQSCWDTAPRSMSREKIVEPMQPTIDMLRAKYKPNG